MTYVWKKINYEDGSLGWQYQKKVPKGRIYAETGWKIDKNEHQIDVYKLKKGKNKGKYRVVTWSAANNKKKYSDVMDKKQAIAYAKAYMLAVKNTRR